MEYRTLGRTGVQVSSLALGTMNFGATGKTTQGQATEIVAAALAAGVNVIDTADRYGDGESEEMVGRAIAGRRDDVVLATKVWSPMSEERNHQGSSRRWIVTELDNSLRRLGVEHVDLYQIHRWDPRTSDEETLSALTDLQRAGKIRYFGSSTYPAHRIVQAQWAAREHHLGRFVSEQPPYSIVQRGIETHVLPVTEEYGMGVLAWSPLASGWLSGSVRSGQEITTNRSKLLPQRFDLSIPANQVRLDAVERLAKVAEQAGLTMIQLALGFVTAHPAVSSAIIGPRTLQHLESQLDAAETVLGADILDAVDEIVAPGVDLAPGEKFDTPPVPARPVLATPPMTTARAAAPSFGIMTPPMQVGYQDILRVWREADRVAEIEHAWLFDHLMPIGGDPDGPVFEGWTLLSALAAQTDRLRVGLMVTSNRFRPPAMLAKIAATVDVVSGGRLEFGIGAGSRPSHPIARREYDAHGLPYHDADHAVASLAEACTVIRRLWTEDEPFDFDGEFVQLTGAFCNPKPARRPPVVIGGRAVATLRVVAEHADVWNIPGGDLDDAVARSEMLDGFCAEIGRDPASVTRSIFLPVPYDDPGSTRKDVAEAVRAGFGHVVLGLAAPYPEGVAQWVADEIIGPQLREVV